MSPLTPLKHPTHGEQWRLYNHYYRAFVEKKSSRHIPSKVRAWPSFHYIMCVIDCQVTAPPPPEHPLQWTLHKSSIMYTVPRMQQQRTGMFRPGRSSNRATLTPHNRNYRTGSDETSAVIIRQRHSSGLRQKSTFSKKLREQTRGVQQAANGA